VADRPNITGLTFGRLRVADFYASERGCRWWSCVCECGTAVIVKTSQLVRGKKRSCGCLRRESLGKITRTHGKSRTPEYRAWAAMKSRCFNPKATGYADYGGRGIDVCERWKNSFENFLDDMGEKPSPAHELDRYPDNNGNYEPGNCRWGTFAEQNNNKRSNRIFVVGGVSATLAEHCRRHGMQGTTVAWRIRKGWSVETAFTKTLRSHKPYAAKLRELKETA
jgi:hypothetical protein